MTDRKALVEEARRVAESLRAGFSGDYCGAADDLTPETAKYLGDLILSLIDAGPTRPPPSATPCGSSR